MSQPAFFMTIDGHGEPHHVWAVREGLAVRVGVPAALDHPNSHSRAGSNRAVKVKLVSHLNGTFGHLAPWRLVGMDLRPGEYYPRIARPSQTGENPAIWCPGRHEYENEIAGIAGQLDYLVEGLSRVLQVVHPVDSSLGVYGHEIRNLLIAACTEVEAAWRAILRANGVVQERYKTDDYAKLLRPLHLREYGVALAACPWLKPRMPFRRWDKNRATKSLAWLNAYNAVKHDREGSFEHAQLAHLLDAIAACVVMAWAQFGEGEFRNRLRARGFFRLSSSPKWKPAELYTPLHEQDASGNFLAVLTPVNAPFQ